MSAHKEYTAIKIDDQEDEIFYDALDYIPTANKLSTSYALTIGATIGYFTGYGIPLGILLPAIDEALMYAGYEKEHYISKAAISATWFGLPISGLGAYIGPYAANILAIVGSAVSTKWGTDIFDQKEQITKVVEATTILNPIFASEMPPISSNLAGAFGYNASKIYNNLAHNKLIQNVALHTVSGLVQSAFDVSFIKSTNINDPISFMFAANHTANDVREWHELVGNIAFFSGLYMLKELAKSGVKIYVESKDQKFQYDAERCIQGHIFADSTVSKEEDQDGLRADDLTMHGCNDAKSLVSASASRIGAITENFVSLTTALSIICAYDHTLLLPGYLVRNNIAYQVREYINTKIPDISHLQTAITNLTSLLSSDFRNITCAGYRDQILDDLAERKTELYNHTSSSRLWQKAQYNIDTFFGIFFLSSDAIYCLVKANAGMMKLDQAPAILSQMGLVSNAITKPTFTEMELNQLKRLKIIFADAKEDPERREVEIDSSNKAVEFVGYSIKIRGVYTIKINHIKFESGCHAISAPNGAGKSSMLQDLKYPASGMLCSGKVKLPCQAEDIIYISQKAFLLPSDGGSIFQSITHQKPGRIDQSQKDVLHAKIRSLATQLKLELPDDKLFNKDYGDVSGGEGKKISIIKAIIGSQKCAQQGITPVIILDEIFNELDDESSHITKHMLREYVSKESIVIIVDHNIKHNNIQFEDGSSFYDSVVVLDDHGSEGRQVIGDDVVIEMA